MHQFLLDVPGEHFVYGEVEQQTVDVVITVYEPNGKQVDAFDTSARGPESFQFIAQETGTYRLEVASYEEGVGRYEVMVQRMEPVATTPADRVSQMMAAYENTDGPGAAIAVVQNGSVIFSEAYGTAVLAHGIPMTVTSVLDVGSVSKQFIGFAMALLEKQGKVSLEEDVRTYLPEVPDFGQTVTLKNLLHHTSGYREVYNTLQLMGRKAGDAVLQEDALAVVQRQAALQTAPGSAYNYNNSGYMLLADVVERVTGQEFHEWMQANIFAPLGMTGTAIMYQPGQVIPHAAESYGQSDDGSGYVRIFDNSSVQGAGGVYSTVEDLARWMDNFQSGTVGNPEIIARFTERGVLTNGDTLDYALGIGVRKHRGLQQWQHGGASAGYRSALVYYPEIDAGVIVLSNLGSFNAASRASQLVAIFFGEHLEDETIAEEPGQEKEEVTSVVVAAEVLKAYVGQYLVEGPNVTVTIEASDGSLMISMNDADAIPMQALSDSTFALASWNATLTFRRDLTGAVSGASVDRGEVFTLRPIEPWMPTADELAAYAGRYFSKEIEAIYTLAVEKDALVLKYRRSADVALQPQDQDRFESTSPLMHVTFERDEEGAISGFSVSNGRTQGIYFEKYD
ncbi:MAG TPA: serine hydrolase domain-containing protein [Rhodothermales bacterium]|nr:serine hydrolase domain-containing protein [Rhodothermales bacterium]